MTGRWSWHSTASGVLSLELALESHLQRLRRAVECQLHRERVIRGERKTRYASIAYRVFFLSMLLSR